MLFKKNINECTRRKAALSGNISILYIWYWSLLFTRAGTRTEPTETRHHSFETRL